MNISGFISKTKAKFREKQDQNTLNKVEKTAILQKERERLETRKAVNQNYEEEKARVNALKYAKVRETTSKAKNLLGGLVNRVNKNKASKTQTSNGFGFGGSGGGLITKDSRNVGSFGTSGFSFKQSTKKPLERKKVTRKNSGTTIIIK